MPEVSRATDQTPAAYRLIIPPRNILHIDSMAGATYLMPEGYYVPAASAATNSQMGVVYLDPADHFVPGKLTKFRIRASLEVNNINTARTFVMGLYPITASAGAADLGNATAGTVTPNSLVTFTNPVANSLNQGNSGDFDAPVAGFYSLGYTSSGAITADSVASISAYLQVHNVPA